MADRTVRAVFEAVTDRAEKNVRGLGKASEDAGKKADGLAKDLKGLDGLTVETDVDVKIDEAKKRLSDITLELTDLKGMEATPEVKAEIEDAQKRLKEVRSEIKDLTGQKAEVRVEVAIGDAEKRLRELTVELGEMRQMDASPEVDVKVKDAQKKIRDVKAEIRELKAAKAEIAVTADTSQAEDAIGDVGDAGPAAGEEAGQGIGEGIINALETIPFAGAVIGVGVAIAGGIILGVKQGLQIEAERDLFGARTGLDEDTAARFGRAAGEAYSQAWGDSVADNLETARVAMEQGLIDADALDADIEQVIASLSGISTIMQQDIPGAARAAGQLIKTGLVDNADEAFDVLVAGYQNGADASHDLLDTLTEYGVFFEKLGLSGAEATGILIQGLEGGAVSGDKVADMLKELTITFADGGETAALFAETTGISVDTIAAKFAEGGPAAREALDLIFEGLDSIEDPALRAQVAMELTKGAGEDLGGALDRLDFGTAADEMGEFEGAAEKALKTMSDNTASEMEAARRNVEVAMDGIKGALAEAFSDDIGGAAEWVSQNREAIMQFFLDVTNGAFDAAKGFLEFSAMSLEAIAGLIDGLDKLLMSIQPVGELLGVEVGEIRSNLAGVADGMRDAGETMRGDWTDRLDEMQSKANEWAAPELMNARVHDATMKMTAEMDAFSAFVDSSGGTVEINGDTMNAEQALDFIVSNINVSDGTVTIDGDRVPADRALSVLMGKVRASKGSVTIGGDAGPGYRSVNGLVASANGRRASVNIGADTTAAELALAAFLGRPRYMYIQTRVAGVGGSAGGLLRHDGGWIPRGLNAGGWVPGSDPGYDNVLWPLNSGGRTLSQPLTGGEYVVNSQQSALWGPMLEAINAGLTPGAPAAPAAPAMTPAQVEAIVGAVMTRMRPVSGARIFELAESGRREVRR